MPKQNYSTYKLLSFVAVFIVIGSSLLLFARASTPTGGSLVVSQSAGVGRGSYDISITLGGAGARAAVTLNNQSLAQFGISGSSQTVTVPVFINSSADSIAVYSVPPIGQSAAKPLSVSNVHLTAATPSFTAQGNKILDPAGKPFTFRGFNRGSLASTSAGWWLGYNDINMMNKWGANSVRLIISNRFWMPNMCEYDAGYKGRVDQQINWITSQGMVADINLQNSTAGSTCPGAGFKLQKMTDSLTIPFWQDVATRYKGNQLVVFEPVNEPHDITNDVWRNGGTVDGWQAVGVQQLYDTIRGTGARNLVLIDGRGYSSDITVAKSQAIDGYGEVYAPHGYCNDQQSPAACAGGALNANLSSNVDSVKADYPIVFTEFGKSHLRDAAPIYNQNFLAYANAHGYGWMAYQWSFGNDDYGLLDGWTSKLPNAAGIPVRGALWAARGWSNYGGAVATPAPVVGTPMPQTPPAAPVPAGVPGKTPDANPGSSAPGSILQGVSTKTAVSGSINLPVGNAKVYLDGVLMKGQIDTTTLTDGKHTLLVATKKADGTVSSKSQTVIVNNHLNWFGRFRNTLFKPWAGRPAKELNIWFIGLCLLIVAIPTVFAIYIRWRWFPKKRPPKPPKSPPADPGITPTIVYPQN